MDDTGIAINMHTYGCTVYTVQHFVYILQQYNTFEHLITKGTKVNGSNFTNPVPGK